MDKILILTLHSDNHGAVLQNYALQTAAGELGFQAETLAYRSKDIGLKYPAYFWPRNTKNIGEFIRKTVRYMRNYRKYPVKHAAFQRFRDAYLSMTKEMTKQELPALNGQYNIFIAGSDQIWNPNLITEDDLCVYTLQFAHGARRAAYAASAGSARNLSPQLVEWISTLDYISVRERSLKERLEQCGVSGVRAVCDPVFLLERERWERLLPAAPPHENPYVFVYIVCTDDICRLARDIAAERGLAILHVDKHRTNTVGFGKSRFEAGPTEFLSYIAHAEVVALASFHGLAFSIILEKEFFVIHRPGMEDRTRDLLDALGLSERGFDSYEEYCRRKDSIPPINWREVKEKLARLREDSWGVLREICNLPNSHV